MLPEQGGQSRHRHPPMKWRPNTHHLKWSQSRAGVVAINVVAILFACFWLMSHFFMILVWIKRPLSNSFGIDVAHGELLIWRSAAIRPFSALNIRTPGVTWELNRATLGKPSFSMSERGLWARWLKPLRGSGFSDLAERSIPRGWQFLGFGIQTTRLEDTNALDVISVAVPFWAPFTVMAAIAVRLHYRRGARLRAVGRCVNCGYDLRATPTRCPECGIKQPPIASAPKPTNS
jgi:hypothetical protein